MVEFIEEKRLTSLILCSIEFNIEIRIFFFWTIVENQQNFIDYLKNKQNVPLKQLYIIYLPDGLVCGEIGEPVLMNLGLSNNFENADLYELTQIFLK